MRVLIGVVNSFNAQGKVMVNICSNNSGGNISHACAKGDLLERNGDGTKAKVQSDDIIRLAQDNVGLKWLFIGNSLQGYD